MKATPHLIINNDKKCKQCGKGCAAKTPTMDAYGVCLDCAAKNLKRKRNMNIELIDKAKAEISGLLDNYAVQICKAYTQNEDELTVSLSLKFTPGKPANSIEMEAKIAFIESKVKDWVKVLFNEKQMGLFE